MTNVSNFYKPYYLAARKCDSVLMHDATSFKKITQKVSRRN